MHTPPECLRRGLAAEAGKLAPHDIHSDAYMYGWLSAVAANAISTEKSTRDTARADLTRYVNEGRRLLVAEEYNQKQLKGATA